MDPIAAVIDELRRGRRFAITTHIRADGDAIGAELGLHHALLSMGKRSYVVNDGLVPKVYQFLPGAAQIETSGRAPMDVDAVIAVDCPAIERLGKVGELVSRQRRKTGQPRLINIDHHKSNTNFGDINWVDAAKSSVGEMIYDLLLAAGEQITPEVAVALYVAIITDTGRFTQRNTTPSCLHAAAKLVDLGVNPDLVGEEVYRKNSYRLLKLRSLAFDTLRLEAQGRIAVIRLTQEMFRQTQTHPIDTQEFVDIPRSIEGVNVAVLLRELDEPGKIKVSLRSGDAVDVCQIAQRFGGGGHTQAAGCEVPGTIDQAEQVILAEIRKEMGRR
ncbi:MAG: bifunctional oligoribonuclease/PAP phosphatase NrnA [Planctomycetes bacterium]|nr:bifunctional oligoribonuclease/PAP phosphatase NrnA [Planctomycetota bacterium]MBM4078820.1 bifunctional oligoribonuclease/PAP phosphatase NrnA [Planctomycetota bacterium]